MKRVAVSIDDIFKRHIPGPSHVETPERLTAIYDAIQVNFREDELVKLPLRRAEEDILLLNHTEELVRLIETTSHGKGYFSLDPDTVTCPESYEVASYAAGSLLELADNIIRGDVDNGFCLIRPPGHHAEEDRAMGFCLFNNVAICARYIQKTYNMDRIMIVDFDLHHGNGTQRSFYDDDSVFYFSTHQYPYYPGTGALDERGSGKGQGFTLNCPLSAGCDDSDFAAIMRDVFMQAARSYRPEFIIVSAGFDTYIHDPLGGMNVTGKGFSAMGYALKEAAEEVCDGRLLFSLEGGYSMKGLKEGVVGILKVLLERPQDTEEVTMVKEFFKNAAPHNKGARSLIASISIE